MDNENKDVSEAVENCFESDPAETTVKTEKPEQNSHEETKSAEVSEVEKLRQQLKEEKERAEKRVRDAQAAMHKATQEAAELRRKAEQSDSHAKDDDWNFDDVDEDEEKPKEEETEKPKEESAQEASELEKRFNAQAEEFKKEHADFEQVALNEDFIKAVQENEDLRKKWFGSERTPEILYNLGKEFSEKKVTEEPKEAEKEKPKEQEQKTKEESEEEYDFEKYDIDEQYVQMNSANSRSPDRANVEQRRDEDPFDFL